ncbi:TatD family hydrolase [Candidatus Woesearchaeota archaeon]|nr:TatD family hydrolase [Candidatus Woesearchaeota archaeon]
MLVDIHAHLDHSAFKDDLNDVIERAKNVIIVANGVNPSSNRFALELSKKFKNVKCAMGIYPIEVLQEEAKSGEYPIKIEEFDADEEIEFIRKNKDNIVALGEVGLDYAILKSKAQKDVFEKIIKLSEQIKKPLIVHSRKAEQDVIDMLESSSNKKIVLHCFCGKKQLVKKANDKGWYFTVPTNVVRSQQMQFIVEATNINNLVTETDAPYLSPFQDKRNEPSFIIEAVKKIAEIKKMDVIEVENVIFKNYMDLL